MQAIRSWVSGCYTLRDSRQTALRAAGATLCLMGLTCGVLPVLAQSPDAAKPSAVAGETVPPIQKTIEIDDTPLVIERPAGTFEVTPEKKKAAGVEPNPDRDVDILYLETDKSGVRRVVGFFTGRHTRAHFDSMPLAIFQKAETQDAIVGKLTKALQPPPKYKDMTTTDLGVVARGAEYVTVGGTQTFAETDNRRGATRSQITLYTEINLKNRLGYIEVMAEGNNTPDDIAAQKQFNERWVHRLIELNTITAFDAYGASIKLEAPMDFDAITDPAQQKTYRDMATADHFNQAALYINGSIPGGFMTVSTPADLKPELRTLSFPDSDDGHKQIESLLASQMHPSDYITAKSTKSLGTIAKGDLYLTIGRVMTTQAGVKTNNDQFDIELFQLTTMVVLHSRLVRLDITRLGYNPEESKRFAQSWDAWVNRIIELNADTDDPDSTTPQAK